ncbi:MAG: SDR family NAD(P)-dependent oxidoreductase [Chloroflexota bacterium]
MERAVITGGAQGIGEAAARRLARDGARIVVADRNAAGAAEVAAAIAAAGGEAFPFACDVTASDDCAALMAAAAAAWGGIDILVNCAGVLARHDILGTSEAEWDLIMDVNVKGTFLACKHAIPHMARGGGGSIVNIASGAALVGAPELIAYAASKAAVLSLTKCLAVDHAKDGIRVNALCPGNIDTEMNRAQFRLAADPAAARRAAELIAPQGRLGSAEEVAEVIAWVCSPACAFMTGAPVILDGGLTVAAARTA